MDAYILLILVLFVVRMIENSDLAFFRDRQPHTRCTISIQGTHKEDLLYFGGKNEFDINLLETL